MITLFALVAVQKSVIRSLLAESSADYRGLNSARQCVLLVGSGFEISKGGTIFIGVTGSSQALSDTVVKRFVACCLLCKTCAHHGLREDGAPAFAYLRAAPDCNLTFVKPGREDTFESYRWYCCSYCHTHQIPLEFHVGDVFSSDPTNLKPVVDSEWDMQKPEPVAAVRNTYVTEQVSVSLA